MQLQIEVRPGEGGDDAKMLVHEHGRIYMKYAANHGLKAEFLSEDECGHSWLIILITGPKDKLKRLLKESGGHRYQRIPPNERRGRVHTSTVTVAVLEPVQEYEWVLPEHEVEIRTTRDSGPGGQHRNTTDSAVVATHKPTGLTAKSAGKSQHQNRKTARSMLERKVRDLRDAGLTESINLERRSQVGSGMRGDKVRTYRVKDNRVVDDKTGRKYPLKPLLRGELEIFD